MIIIFEVIKTKITIENKKTTETKHLKYLENIMSSAGRMVAEVNHYKTCHHIAEQSIKNDTKKSIVQQSSYQLYAINIRLRN